MVFDFTNYSEKWQDSPLGRALVAEESKVVSQFRQDFSYTSWLQIGGPKQLDVPQFPDSILNKRISLPGDSVNEQLASNKPLIIASNKPPFPEENFELVVLWHSLEIADDLQQTIFEAERVLKGEGFLIVIAVNPLSSFGIKHLYDSCKNRSNKVRYLRAGKIKRNLKKNNLTIFREQKLFFRPPIDNEKFLRTTLFLEPFGAMFANCLGNVNVIFAQKKLFSYTPVPDTCCFL